MKLKVTSKNSEASQNYLQEYSRVERLYQNFVQKQAEAQQKLERLLREKETLDTEFLAELDAEKIDKLGKKRRDLRLAIEDEELLVTLDVALETKRHMNAAEKHIQAAIQEFNAFKHEADAELAELEKKYKANKAEIEDLLAAHPFSQAQSKHLRLLNLTRVK